MASPLIVPDRLMPGFVTLSNLTDKNFKSLVASLSSLKGLVMPDTLKKAIDEAVGQHDGNRDLANVVYSFSGAVEAFEKPISQISQELAISFIGNLKTDQKGKHDKKRIEHRLSTVLTNVQALEFTGKASGLVLAYDRVYEVGRVMTDVRFMFGKNIDQDLGHAVITHSLEIAYTQDGDSKTVYFALNQRNLSKLKDVLERAIKKELAIKKKLGKSTKIISFDDAN